MIEFLVFLWRAAKLYRRAGAAGCVYGSAQVLHFGIPRTTIFVARGREAWRVSTIAMQVLPNIPIQENKG